MKHTVLFAILSLVTLTSAFAAEDKQPDINSTEAVSTVTSDAIQTKKQNNPLHYVLGAGLTFGGDTLVTIQYTDGSSDDITAGSLLMFYGGLDYRLNDTISVQGTIGYHFDSAKPATNGDASFNRIPLELLAYYHVNDTTRLGSGVRYVMGPKLKGSGIASGANQSFDNTLGLVIEGEYMLHRTFGIKVRHVSENYHPTGSPISIDGSHFGVLANFYF